MIKSIFAGIDESPIQRCESTQKLSHTPIRTRTELKGRLSRVFKRKISREYPKGGLPELLKMTQLAAEEPLFLHINIE